MSPRTIHIGLGGNLRREVDPPLPVVESPSTESRPMPSLCAFQPVREEWTFPVRRRLRSSMPMHACPCGNSSSTHNFLDWGNGVAFASCCCFWSSLIHLFRWRSSQRHADRGETFSFGDNPFDLRIILVTMGMP